MTRTLALLLILGCGPALAQSTTIIRENGRKVGEIRHSSDGKRAVEYRAGHRIGETRFSDDGRKAVEYQGGRRVREYETR